VQSVKQQIEEQQLFPDLDETYRMREAVVGLLLDGGYRPSP
jgi:oxygen-independent coproporphyrinogen-3 oxidase